MKYQKNPIKEVTEGTYVPPLLNINGKWIHQTFVNQTKTQFIKTMVEQVKLIPQDQLFLG